MSSKKSPNLQSHNPSDKDLQLQQLELKKTKLEHEKAKFQLEKEKQRFEEEKLEAKQDRFIAWVFVIAGIMMFSLIFLAMSTNVIEKTFKTILPDNRAEILLNILEIISNILKIISNIFK